MNTYKPIKIHFRWNRESFEKAFENSYNFEFKNSIRRYIGWLFIAMAQFGVVFALKGGKIGLLMLSTILIVYWYFIKKLLVKKRVLKEFENSLKDRDIKLEITEDGIEQNKTLIKWDKIKSITPVGDDILIYINNKPFYIPSNGFKNLEDRSNFKELAKKKGKFYV